MYRLPNPQVTKAISSPDINETSVVIIVVASWFKVETRRLRDTATGKSSKQKDILREDLKT